MNKWALSPYSLQASIAELANTVVGMHGLLAIVNRVTILCYLLVCVHCGPVVDFFITKQTSLYIPLILLEIFSFTHCIYLIIIDRTICCKIVFDNQ